MEPAKADREYPLGEIIIKTGKESQEHMSDTRTDELYRALQDKGYPDELCQCWQIRSSAAVPGFYDLILE